MIMVLVQIWPFFHLFILDNVGPENVFYNAVDKGKTPFYAIKTRSSKSGKIEIFERG